MILHLLDFAAVSEYVEIEKECLRTASCWPKGVNRNLGDAPMKTALKEALCAVFRD